MSDFQRGIWHQAPDGPAHPGDFFRAFFEHWNDHLRPLPAAVRLNDGTTIAGSLGLVDKTYAEFESIERDVAVPFAEMTAAMILPEPPLDASTDLRGGP